MKGLSDLLYSIINSARRPLSTAEVEERARKRTKKKFSSAVLRGTLYHSTKIKIIRKMQDGRVHLYFTKLAA